MRTGRQAVAQMRRWHENKRTGVKGLCLKTVREAYGLPARYPSAIVAWRNTPARFKHKDFKTAPIGACHYYEGGKYGHIVIQSESRNRVYGTDLPITDRVGFHHRRMPINRWKYKYLGWTSWLNGHELKLGGMPK
jgi:hypothetical protein